MKELSGKELSKASTTSSVGANNCQCIPERSVGLHDAPRAGLHQLAV